MELHLNILIWLKRYLSNLNVLKPTFAQLVVVRIDLVKDLVWKFHEEHFFVEALCTLKQAVQLVLVHS